MMAFADILANEDIHVIVVKSILHRDYPESTDWPATTVARLGIRVTHGLGKSRAKSLSAIPRHPPGPVRIPL